MDTSEIKHDIIEYLKREGQHKDMVDIASYIGNKYNVSVDIPATAVWELEQEKRIQRVQHGLFRPGYKVIEV